MDEDVDEDAIVNNAVHVVRDDESSTDDNLDMLEDVAEQVESEDEYESADEDDEPIASVQV